MDVVPIRGWGLSSPGGAGFIAPANKRSANGVAVSTPCGAVSTPENSSKS